MVQVINKFGDELYAKVEGEGIHVREEAYTATVIGILDNTNYVLSDEILNDPKWTVRQYYITPATVEFEEEVLTKQYNGEFQQPDFTPKLLGEDDELIIEVDGGGINVDQYTVTLSLGGKSAGDYKLAYRDENKLFRIIKKEVTVTATSKDINERYTGNAIDFASWVNWYDTSLNDLLDADADKSVSEIFSIDTLHFVPKIYEAVATVALFAEGEETPSNELTQVVDKGEYIIVPHYVDGWLSGSENYVLKGVLSEDGTLIVGGKVYVELTDESKYQFVYEKEEEIGFKYRRAYGETGMVHGVDDVNFQAYVLGQIPLETTINDFLTNFVDDTFKLYSNKNELVIENGRPAEGFEDVLDDDSFYVGSGWRIEYGDGDERDIVYISVLGDLTGDGMINHSDTALIGHYIANENELNLWQRLSCMLTNNGSLNALDMSAMSRVMDEGNSAISNYYTYIEVE